MTNASRRARVAGLRGWAAATGLALAWLAGGQPAMADLRLRAGLGVATGAAPAGSLDQVLGFARRRTGSASLRVMSDTRAGALRFQAHLLIEGAQGDDMAYRAARAALFGAPPPATALDLSTTLRATGTEQITARLDRLSVGWSSQRLVLRIGRQAVTWGSGYAFHPGDIVAPFAPGDGDRSYKPGVDMLYAQYLFDSGADIQAVAVPRPAVAGGPIEADASTLAFRASFSLGALDGGVMLARDRGATLAGLSLSGPLGDATWKAEHVGWWMKDGSYRPSWVLNLSGVASLAGVPVAWFGEVYHNGFGAEAGATLATLPEDLRARMATGQVFVTGRDLAALGATVPIGADLTLRPGVLVSLRDGSAFYSVAATLAIDDNSELSVRWTHPAGAPGRDFGGLETAPGSGVFASPATGFSFALARYF